MATYKIKLEDKAAFLNRLEKQGEGLKSTQIKDNKLKGYFEVTINDPEQLEIAKAILKQSPKINTIKEMKKLTKNQLSQIIREELNNVKKEKQLKEDATAFAWIPAAAAALGIAGTALKSIMSIMKQKGYKGLEGFMKAAGEFKSGAGDVASKF